MSATTPTKFKYLSGAMVNQLHGVTIAARHSADGLKQGLHRSRHYGSSVEFAEYRQYVPGDPADKIDWMVYARSDKFMIRKSHEETTLEACVILDCSASMDWSQHGEKTKFDYAAELACSFLYVLFNQGDCASMATFGAEHIFHEKAGSFDKMAMLWSGFEEIKPSGDGTAALMLEKLLERWKRKTLAIVISDFLEDYTSLQKQIARMKQAGHDVALLHVLDSGELVLEGQGIYEVRDSETSQKIEASFDDLRVAYSAEVNNWLESLRYGAGAAGADYSFITTDMPLMSAVMTRARRL